MSQDGQNNERENAGDVTLCAADAAAVDAFIESRGAARPSLDELLQAEMKETAAVDAVDPQRLARVQAWVDVMKQSPEAPAPAGLLERTLAAVQQERMKLPSSQTAISAPHEEPRVRSRWSRRFGEIGAIAIAASILVAVLIPGISQARQSSKRVACASNLGQMASAFASYGAANNGELPGLAAPADGNWLPHGPGFRPEQTVAAGHSNTANLLPMISAHYMPATRLLCAGRGVPTNEVIDLSSGDVPENVRGYSYINLYGSPRPRWDGRHSNIVLGDRNPLFGSYVTDNVHANSFNHRAAGNYVVRADGTISWETSPDVGVDHDNIWTIGKENQRFYKGTETVTFAGDTFLSP